MSQTHPDTVTLTIDGQTVTVPKGTLLIEAARRIGIDIPHYCYDPDLSVVASCRLCLVEIEKVPKLQPSCSTPVSEGQVVLTCSEKVLEARRMQMEFLLVQHPLDCPVCDQGGECKLQDYSRKHGMADTRFDFHRRTFPKPDIGPFIDLERNRCILCSRCVRFMNEIAGEAELTVVQRGWKSYIATFQDRPLKNEFAGNTIDLCPVGALTSKVTRFRTRVWELKSRPSICTLCSVGCNIHLQYRNRTREILRVVPRPNEGINHRWICDVGRFGFDRFNNSARLVKPLIEMDNGEKREASWAEAIGLITNRLSETIGAKDGHAVAGIVGPTASNETLFLFQQFFRELLHSNNIDHRTEHISPRKDDGYLTSIALRSVNAPFEEIRRASTILLLGSDLPNELPILHLHLRKRAGEGAEIYAAHHRPTRLDSVCAGTWQYTPGSETLFLTTLLQRTAEKMGTTLPQEIEEILSTLCTGPFAETTGIAESDLNKLTEALNRAERAALLIGESLFAGKSGPVNVRLAAELAHLVNDDPRKPLPLSLLLPHSNSRGAADMGCYPHRGAGYTPVQSPGRNTTQILEGCLDGSIQALILFQTDLIEEYPDRDLVQRALEQVPFLVVADSYPFSTMQYANAVLPLSTCTEEEGTYTNLGGCVQRTEAAVSPLPGTLAGYQVLLALGERWGAEWRQVSPAKLFETIVRSVPHYAKMMGKERAELAAETGGRFSIPVDISLFQTTLSSSTLSSRTFEGAPSKEYPYRLVRGRFLFDASGEKRFAPPLVKRREECRVEIHPGDALALGIAENQDVTIAGPLGSIRLPVRITAATPPGCVTLLGQYENPPANGLAAENRPWVAIQP